MTTWDVPNLIWTSSNLRFFRQESAKESYHGEEFRVAGNLPWISLVDPHMSGTAVEFHSDGQSIAIA